MNNLSIILPIAVLIFAFWENAFVYTVFLIGRLIRLVFKATWWIIKAIFSILTFWKSETKEKTNVPSTKSDRNIEEIDMELKPVALNDVNKGLKVLEAMENLISKLTNDRKIELVGKDLKRIKSQVQGDLELIKLIEKSNKPVNYLYDISISHQGFTANIDFLIITDNCLYIADTSSIETSIIADGNMNFSKESDGGTKYLLSPLDTLSIKENILRNKLTELGYASSFNIRSSLVVANKNASLKTAKKSPYIYESPKKFLDSISCSKEPTLEMKRMGLTLSEFNEKAMPDYLEVYNLESRDFKPVS